jgi:hypothetical protein
MKKYFTLLLTGSVFILGSLNELYDFYNNFNMSNGMDFIKILDLIGTIFLPIIIAYFIYKYIKIEDFFEKEKLQYKNYKEKEKSLDDKLESIEKQNKSLIEINNRLIDDIKTNNDNSLITTRILRDVIIDNYISNSQEEKDIFAKILLDNLFNIPQLKKYGLDETILTYMQSHYINDAKYKIDKKLNNQKNNQNKPKNK